MGDEGEVEGTRSRLGVALRVLQGPVDGSSDRLSMLSAAHHLVGSHALAPAATAHVGHSPTPGIELQLGERAARVFGRGWVDVLESLSGVHVLTCSGTTACRTSRGRTECRPSSKS